MEIIQSNFIKAAANPSDINEHLLTLYNYAHTCNHVTECGVRGVTSSWAFAAALVNRPNTKLISIDLDTNSNVKDFLNITRNAGLNTVFY